MADPISIAEMALAAHDIARWERQRIDLTNYLALRGGTPPPGGIELGGWEQRLKGLTAAAELLTALSVREPAVLALAAAPLPAAAAAEAVVAH